MLIEVGLCRCKYTSGEDSEDGRAVCKVSYKIDIHLVGAKLNKWFIFHTGLDQA